MSVASIVMVCVGMTLNVLTFIVGFAVGVMSKAEVKITDRRGEGR